MLVQMQVKSFVKQGVGDKFEIGVAPYPAK